MLPILRSKACPCEVATGIRPPPAAGASFQLHRGGAPTVPLDPPTAYTLGALFVLLGTGLVRAGRGTAAFHAAAVFSCFFAATIQYFLYRYPAWMYAYAVSEELVKPGYVAVPFFLAVSGAGLAGAHVSLHLIRAGRTALAVVNVLGGAVVWGSVWAATLHQYMNLARSTQEYRFGIFMPVDTVPEFQLAITLVGAAQGVVGVSLAVWLVVAGYKARKAQAIQPDPVATPWRQVAEGPRLSLPASPSPVEGGIIRGSRPGDGAPLPEVAATPLSELPALLTRARVAQAAWARVPLKERAAKLAEVGKRLLAAAEEQARLIEEENGRPAAESYFFEVLPNADLFSYWTGEGPTLLNGEEVKLDPVAFPGKRGVIERVPRGVVLVISPWNMPVNLPLRPTLPALLAGNAVVLKPSEFTPRCGALLERIFGEVLPPHVFQVAQGGGDVGQGLIEGGVELVAFTGSPRTGRAVAVAAAKALTPAALELGGKDAAIVLADADLERAAAGLTWAAFANAGQNCAGLERCYVAKEVAPALVALLTERLCKLRVGPGPEGEVEVGPLTTPQQKALVLSQLAEARERGVKVIGGEATGTGLYVKPALLVDPPEELALCSEETFGPVLPIFVVADEEEAIRRANASVYGLTASVWSKDTARAERLGRRLQAGVVTVNNHSFTGGIAQAPWGGVRGSGYGITNSAKALDEVTRPRFVLVDHSKGKRELWWHPYDLSALDVGRGMARLRSGDRGGLGQLLRGFLKRGKA